MPERERKLPKILFILSFPVALFLSIIFTPIFYNHVAPPPSDATPPVIELKGNDPLNLYVGDPFEDPGASATDDCSPVTVWREGEVDTSAEGTYTLTYFSVDAAENAASVTRTVNVRPAPIGTVYLTFDDGPGPHTARLLDVLQKYGAKVTFFVTGAGDDDLIRREHAEGHTVALHTFSHNYAYVYSSPTAYFADLAQIQERVKNLTGETVMLIRFPGGSSNAVSKSYDGSTHIMSYLAHEVEARGFTYFDWNVSSGDAGGAKTADDVFNNVTSRLTGPGPYVVLQHDIKDFSVDAVERILQYGLDHGYVFKALDTSSYPAHHGINN